MTVIKNTDVIIVGAGAAGLMCAIEAGKRGRRVMIIERSKKIAGKIFISGGGRCNFTNLNTHPSCYLSHNQHFCKSALSRYTHRDFIALIERYGLSWHEKASKNAAGYLSDDNQGQLFCDQKSQAIIDALISECEQYGVVILSETEVSNVEAISHNSLVNYSVALSIKNVNQSHLNYDKSLENNNTDCFKINCESFVIATGGPSIAKMGATDFALTIAKQFNIDYYPFVPALVPLVLSPELRASLCYPLAGVSLWVEVSAIHKKYGKKQFKENCLITHKGLSGPAILQISSYWQPGQSLSINLLPEHDALTLLMDAKRQTPHKKVSTVLKACWPAKWLSYWLENEMPKALFSENKEVKTLCADVTLQEFSNAQIKELAKIIHHWMIKPIDTEGMAKAEVSCGGVDCNALSSKTFMVKNNPGLYFLGEAIDVTGFLGGYNFQWAWASGWCAGQVV